MLSIPRIRKYVGTCNIKQERTCSILLYVSPLHILILCSSRIRPCIAQQRSRYVPRWANEALSRSVDLQVHSTAGAALCGLSPALLLNFSPKRSNLAREVIQDLQVTKTLATKLNNQTRCATKSWNPSCKYTYVHTYMNIQTCANTTNHET